MAWRVRADPNVRRAIDTVPPQERRATRASRVSWPSAAKTGAAPFHFAAAFELFRMAEIFLDQRHHRRPSMLVCIERLRAARQRDLIEAGFCDGQKSVVAYVCQSKNDKRRGLARVINFRFDGEGVPPEREQPLRFDAVNSDFERPAFVGFLRLCNFGIDRRRHDYAAHARLRHERALESDAKPAAELRGVGESAPDALSGRVQKYLLFDAVGAHLQPPDCILLRRIWKRNHKVA